MIEALKLAIASELEVEVSDLTSDKLLTDLEGWDSVMVLIVSVIISDMIQSRVTMAEMKNLKTYGDIETLVMSKKSQ